MNDPRPYQPVRNMAFHAIEEAWNDCVKTYKGNEPIDQPIVFSMLIGELIRWAKIHGASIDDIQEYLQGRIDELNLERDDV